MQPQPELNWYSPEELVEVGFRHSRVVMMNEAHSGEKRSVRTRRIGQRILPSAHAAGVRHLAMEALMHDFAHACNTTREVPTGGGMGYLAQPEMLELIQAALDLGWTLVVYESDINKWLTEKHGIQFSPTTDWEEMAARFQTYQAELLSMEFTNWREAQQAQNLIDTLNTLPDETPMLVWCGNGHHCKTVVQEWTPMGHQFKALSGIDPFCIDQTRTVDFGMQVQEAQQAQIVPMMAELEAQGGTAGFLTKDLPVNFGDDPGYDAFIFSTDNAME